MITTNNLKRKPLGKPQRLTVLTTTKIKPKNPEAILAGIKAQQDVLARQVNARPTRKVGGPMLVIGGMEDRVMNQTRKLLREKVKALRAMAAAKPKAKIPASFPLPDPVVISRAQPIESPAPVPEPPIIPDYMKEEPTDWKIAPEKKKRGRPKKEDKETE